MRQQKNNKFPKGWDEDRVRGVLDYYENQPEDEAVAEDEAAFAETDSTVMAVPSSLVPKVRDLILAYRAKLAT